MYKYKGKYKNKVQKRQSMCHIVEKDRCISTMTLSVHNQIITHRQCSNTKTNTKTIQRQIQRQRQRQYSTWTGPPLKSQNYLSARLVLTYITSSYT